MIFPALLAKILSAGAVAQAATGAGVVIVVATGAGATGVLGGDVQDTIVGVVASDEETATDDAFTRLGAQDVHRLCALLPDDQRAVVLLRVLGDLTVDQVAQVMGRSTASVKALQRRGLRALREGLEQSSERVGPAANPFAAARR